VAFELKRDWPVVAAGAVALGGLVWAARSTRTGTVQSYQVVQPGAAGPDRELLAMQVSLEQTRMQTQAQLLGGLLGALVEREQAQAQLTLGIAQTQAALAAAQAQAAAQVAAAQAEAQAMAALAQTQVQVAQIQAQAEIEAAKAQAAAAQAQSQAQAQAAQAQAQAAAQAAQAQAQAQTVGAIVSGLALIFALFSPERTEQARLRRLYTSRGVLAQARAGRLYEQLAELAGVSDVRRLLAGGRLRWPFLPGGEAASGAEVSGVSGVIKPPAESGPQYAGDGGQVKPPYESGPYIGPAYADLKYAVEQKKKLQQQLPGPRGPGFVKPFAAGWWVTA